MLLILILAVPLALIAYVHEDLIPALASYIFDRLIPAWQFRNKMKARRHRAHTFA